MNFSAPTGLSKKNVAFFLTRKLVQNLLIEFQQNLNYTSVEKFQDILA